MKSRRPELNVDTLTSFVGHRFVGAGLIELSPGKFARAFRFTAPDGKYVIRISKQREHLLKDRYAQNEYGARIKVPEFIEFGNYQPASFYAVTKYVVGQPICRQGHISRGLVISERLKKSFIGNLMKISSSPVRGSGFGKVSNDGNGKYDSWREFLTTTEIELEPETHAKLVRAGLLDGKLLSDTQEAINELTQCSHERRYLVHGDYQSYNVIARYGKIAATLDWANMLWGDFAMDLFLTSYFERDFANLAAEAELCDEYSRSGFDMNDIERRLLVCKLRTFVSWLFEYIEAGELESSSRLQKELGKTLEDV